MLPARKHSRQLTSFLSEVTGHPAAKVLDDLRGCSAVLWLRIVHVRPPSVDLMPTGKAGRVVDRRHNGVRHVAFPDLFPVVPLETGSTVPDEAPGVAWASVFSDAEPDEVGV